MARSSHPHDRPSQTIEDEFLVIECQRGNAEAFDALVSRWQPRFRAYVARLTGSADMAMEALQDGWISIVRNIRSLDDPARFPAWGFRIMHHRCADCIRQAQRSRRNTRSMMDRTSMSDVTETDNDSEDDGLSHDIRAAIDELSIDDRAIIMLHYIEGLSMKQISSVLDIPAGTVKSRLYHARERLRDTIARKEQHHAST